MNLNPVDNGWAIQIFHILWDFRVSCYVLTIGPAPTTLTRSSGHTFSCNQFKVGTVIGPTMYPNPDYGWSRTTFHILWGLEFCALIWPPEGCRVRHFTYMCDLILPQQKASSTECRIYSIGIIDSRRTSSHNDNCTFVYQNLNVRKKSNRCYCDMHFTQVMDSCF